MLISRSCNDYWRIYAELKAGGKPSTWFPPGGTRRAGCFPFFHFLNLLFSLTRIHHFSILTDVQSLSSNGHHFFIFEILHPQIFQMFQKFWIVCISILFNYIPASLPNFLSCSKNFVDASNCSIVWRSKFSKCFGF